MSTAQLITPLYDTTNGGAAQAFKCGECGNVTRTAIGMVRHLWRAHRVRQQLVFPELAPPAPTLDQLAQIAKGQQ